MSEESVELAWRAPQAWNEGGDEALIAFLDAEVEWHAPWESMEPGVYRGHDGVRDYLGRLGEMFDERHSEAVEVIEVDDDRVILAVHISARAAHAGVEINAAWAWSITMGANQKVVRVEMFTDKFQALKAVGLRA